MIIMKKHIVIVMAWILCLSVTACGGTATESNSTPEPEATPPVSADEETTAPEEEVVPSDDAQGDDDFVLDVNSPAPEGVQEYEISGYGTIGDSFQLDLMLGNDYGHMYTIEVQDHELGKTLGAFSSGRFNIKLDASGGTLGDYELIDMDGNSLGMLSAEEIKDMYDSAGNYEVVEWNYDGQPIDISQFEEGKIYQSPVETGTTLEFVNNTDTDYRVFVSDDYEYKEMSYAYTVKEIEGIGINKPDIYVFGENVRIRVEKLTADMLDPEDLDIQTAFVNGLGSGEEVFVGTSTVLANAGDEDVTIEVKGSDDATTELTVHPNEIYGIDWMNIMSITVK